MCSRTRENNENKVKTDFWDTLYYNVSQRYCEVLRITECVPPAVCHLLLVIACHLPQHRTSGDSLQILQSALQFVNMEVLLFNKPETESANNNYLCTLQIPLLLIWKDEICNKSMFKLFSIQTSTSTRQKHFCMNGNQKMLDVRRCKAAMFNWECSGPRHLINQSWKHWKQPSCQHRKLLTLHIPECKIAVSFVLSVRPYI